MKSFMSAALQNTEPTQSVKNAPAAECSDCGNTKATATAGGLESTEQQPAQPDQQQQQQSQENAVVVMQGPLGTAITEALNKSLSKKNIAQPVQVPGVGTESLTTEYVQANGQINNPTQLFSKISKAVGLVPAVDSKPTAINTMLDAASKVDDIDFIMVERVDDASPSSAVVPQKSEMQIMYPGNDACEGIAIESVQMVITYRRKG